MDRVVVLDRDGTLVVDRHYLHDPSQLELLPGTAEGLRQLQQLGCRLVIISNQSGVGRGYFSLERMHAVNARLTTMVREAGAELAAIYCCPHAPSDRCGCRKPQPGLMHQAARELGFDPADSIVIGDRASDIELASRVGARSIWISSVAAASAMNPAPDFTAADLAQAAQIIERCISAAR